MTRLELEYLEDLKNNLEKRKTLFEHIDSYSEEIKQMLIRFEIDCQILDRTIQTLRKIVKKEEQDEQATSQLLSNGQAMEEPSVSSPG